MLDRALEQKLLSLIAALDRFSQERHFVAGLNIFEAAGLFRQEIRHSNFLAFLLKPKQPHGLNDGFLRQFLTKALENVPSERPISRLDLVLGDYSDAFIRREWRGLDILIESKSNDLILAIENKIDSSESENQLKRYRELVQSEFPTHHRLFCYLTPEGDDPTDEMWATLDYSDVLDALQKAKALHSANLTQEAKIIIDHYVNLIRRNIVPDQELVEQCRKIYEMHKDALKLIIQYGEVNSFEAAANIFFQNHPEIVDPLIRSRRAVFLPSSVAEAIPPMEGVNWWGQSRPFIFWFNRYNNKLGLVLEVGPFPGNEFNRELLARELLDYFGRNYTIYPNYTRVYSQYRTLTEEEANDSEGMSARMEEFYTEVKNEHLTDVTGILRRFFNSDV